MLTPAVSHGQGSAASSPFNDYQHRLEQLGIRSLQPGPDPNDPYTFDEAKPNPYKDTMPAGACWTG